MARIPNWLAACSFLWLAAARLAQAQYAIDIDLTEQKAYLLYNQRAVLESPISSGRPGHATPSGTFRVINKDLNHTSSIYGLIVDRYGRLRWEFPRPGDLAPGQTFLQPDDAFFSPDGRLIIATQEDDQVISVISVARSRIIYRYGVPETPGSGPGHLFNPDDAMLTRASGTTPDESVVVALRENVAGGFGGGRIDLAQEIEIAGHAVVMPEGQNEQRRVVVDVEAIVVGLAVEHVEVLDDQTAAFLPADKLQQ